MNFLYCGVDNNSHDKRFIKALEKLGAVETFFQAQNANFKYISSKYHAVIVGPLTVPLDFLPSNINVPIIGMSHAFDINEVETKSQEFQTLLSNLKIFDRIICDNSYIKETIEREYKPHIDIDLVPYGCDLEELTKLTPSLGGKIKLLSMRNWTPIHSNQKIVDSIAILDKEDILEQVIFIGDGPKLQEGIASFQNSRVRVHTEFRGFVDKKSMISVLSNSSVYVSSSRSDGSSVSLMEAMAAGLIPCVTDHASNLRIISQGVNGFTYRNQDSTSLAKCLITIFNLSEEDRNQISRNARSYAIKNFNWESNQELLRKSVLESLNAR